MLFMLNYLSQSDFYKSDIFYKKKTRFGPRLQNHLQLVYVKDGSFVLNIDQESIKVNADEFILLRPAYTETFIFEEGTRHGWVNLSHSDLGELNSFQAKKCSTLMNKLISLIPMKEHFPALQENPQSLMCRALFQECISIISNKKDTKDYSPHIHSAIAYCKNNLHSKLDGKLLAAQVGISSAHLALLFKKEIGLTPIKYIWRTRCEEAEKLLLETGLSAAEIAYQCGFSTPNHFSRVFTNHKGQTPGKFRKKHWN